MIPSPSYIEQAIVFRIENRWACFDYVIDWTFQSEYTVRYDPDTIAVRQKEENDNE